MLSQGKYYKIKKCLEYLINNILLIRVGLVYRLILKKLNILILLYILEVLNTSAEPYITAIVFNNNKIVN